MVRQNNVFLFQGRCSYDLAVFASEYLPVHKLQQIQLTKAPPPVFVDEDVIMLGGIETTTDGNMQEESETSDDEIEDW